MKTRLYSLLAACSLGLILNAAAQPPDVRQGLVAYWPLDAHDTLTTPDLAFINTLSVVGSPTVDPGQFGSAFTFVGPTTYLTNLHSPDNAASGLPIYRAGSYTIAMWVKGAPQTAKYLFSEGSVNNNNPLLLLQTGQAPANNAKFDVIIRNDAGTGIPVNHRVSTNIVFDNTWHHVAWVDNRGSARLYVDGNLDPANFNYTPVGTFTFNSTAIGTLVRAAIATGNIFNGQMDDIAVWERALTQAEVQQVMTSSISTPIPPLPPYITTQPVGGSRMVGDRFTFSVSAVGTRPLSYQWLKGAMEVTDATNRTLALFNLTSADSDNYSVRVTAASVSLTSVVATLTVAADPAVDLRQGLVSHWPLDVENPDMDGLASPDLYSNNAMREITAVPAFLSVPGNNGNALAFNGVDQYAVRRGGFPIYSNPGYSVSLWVKGIGTGQSDRRFFSESSTNSNNPLFNLGTHATGVNGAIRVFIRNDAGATLLAANSTRIALDDTWHHVVWTETNGFGRLYIDGVLDETDFIYTRATPLTLDQTTLAAIFRNNVVSNYFAGALDDVAVWNRVLTFSEIDAIRTTGIPPSLMAIPPSITQHPASLSLLTKSKATFTFQSTGTSPLFPQWRKNGGDLVDETNLTLVLNNLMLSDAGDYDVVVTNSGGGATSLVATLTVGLRPPSPEVLSVDINNTGIDDSPANTEAGFSPYSIPMIGTGPFTRNFGGADVTFTAIGTTMESRKRALPTNNPPFTEARLLQDFIFTRDATVDQGLDVAIEFMEPNTPYRVSIWSYDNSSSGRNRISDWTANGVPGQVGWSFIGTTLPVDNNTYRFNFDAVSDTDGKILIQARRNAGATLDIHCFINAFRVEKRRLRIVSLANFMNLDITLVFEALNPGAVHRIESRTHLGTGAWANVPDALFVSLGGNLIQATFSAPFPATDTQFYQVVQDP